MLCSLRSPKQLVVLTVEKVGHTMPRLGVLLGIKSAAPAKNIGIIRSIVEVLRKVSLRREAEHIEKETGIRDVKIPSPNDPLTE